MRNTFGVRIAQPSKVESYLEVNALTDDDNLAYWTHKYYTKHITAS